MTTERSDTALAAPSRALAAPLAAPEGFRVRRDDRRGERQRGAQPIPLSENGYSGQNDGTHTASRRRPT